jgi:hypothetical protein
MAVAPPLQGIVWGTNVVGMPGAVAPSAPTTQTAPTTFDQQPGAIASNKKRRQKEKKRQKQQQQQQQQATATTSSNAAPASDGKTAAERREEQRQRQAERRAAREEARRNRFNPFTAPFKSPAELRAEAARLAALGSPTEQALRAQQQQEEAGLTGLTSGLTTALRGVSEAQTAGLAGLGSLYQQLGGAAQSAAQSAAAAAGAPTSIAPGVTPTAIASFPGIGAAVRAYESVAPVIGAQMVGASRANLAKALTQRASQVSSDTAKYLRQLQQEEIDRAISQTTAEQNLARLGLSEQEFGLKQQDVAFGQQLDIAKLNLAQQKVAAQIQKDAAKAGKDKRKAIKSAQARILSDPEKWKTGSTGEREFEFSWLDENMAVQRVTGVGVTKEQAFKSIVNALPPNTGIGDLQVSAGKLFEGQLGSAAIIAKVVPLLVGAGMTRRNAEIWVRRNLLGGVGIPGTGGAFMGGVV